MRVILIALIALVLSGCGASAQLRTAYSLEVARCIANERAIVDRADTTAEQDHSDLAAERTRCDSALHAIEGSE